MDNKQEEKYSKYFNILLCCLNSGILSLNLLKLKGDFNYKEYEKYHF
ncbi:MAG: hypothetical protein K0R49_249 [Burkholderiales bacterium]|jgi:hypothetical protein|nr:hypothetical protein [Burkholderiales bacterium]